MSQPFVAVEKSCLLLRSLLAISLGFAGTDPSRDRESFGHPAAAGREPLVSRGVLVGDFPIVADLDMAAVVEGADAVDVAVPSTGMKETLDRLAPGTVVVISGHLSFAALHLHRALAHHGIAVPVCAWATTPVRGRRFPMEALGQASGSPHASQRE